MNYGGGVWSDLARQARRLRWQLVAIYAVPAALMALLVVIRSLAGIRTSWLTRDPVQVLEAPFYIGAYSQLGNLLWCCCASICAFTAVVLASRDRSHSHLPFLAWAAALTSLLLADDMFILHEEVFPALGLPEGAVSVVYAGLALLFLVRWQAIIRATDYLLLIAALLLLGVSAGLDRIVEKEFPGYFIIEDGAKLFGIVSWSAYFVSLCWRQIVSSTPKREVVNGHEGSGELGVDRVHRHHPTHEVAK